MNKIKNVIHKIKVSFYGMVGRAQFPDQLTEPAAIDNPATEEPKAEEPPQVEVAKKPAKKTAAKSAVPAKKPGRPKGSKSAPKN